jgi:CRP/FNR family transcriptional regulator, anaerobic regulatory protein
MMESHKILELQDPTEIKQSIGKYGYQKSFSEDDIILNEDEGIRAIPIVLSGSIRVMRTDDDGRELLLYYVKPGESCIMSFLAGVHHDTSKLKGIADENTEILFIPVDKVTELVRSNPEWLEYIFRLYHKRFEELLDLVNAIAFKRIDERLMNMLRKKAELGKSKTISVTHEQLANDLGTARVVVSRILKQFEENGLLKLGRNKIELV